MDGRQLPRRMKASGSGRFHYILFNKPYGVVSQFTAEGGKRSLREFGPFPRDVYAVGRLDEESEGLLLLTNDNAVKHRLTTPVYDHPRSYFVQVERIPDRRALERLREGVILGGKKTRPALVRLLSREPLLPPRTVPIRFRKNVPTAWLEITLREGRNRQVRRMTAAVGHPTLRLVRVRIGDLSTEGLVSGKSRVLSVQEIADLYRTLGLGGRSLSVLG